MAPDEHNQKGYFESKRLISYHDEVLARLGSRAADPLPLPANWTSTPIFGDAVDQLVEILAQEFEGQTIRLFKDPRMCRLVPVWLEALRLGGWKGVFILPYRHPWEVAASLKVRAGLAEPHSLSMWLQHTVLAERYTRHLPRAFVAYHDLLSGWRHVVHKISTSAELGLPPISSEREMLIDGFLEPSLRRQRREAALEQQNHSLGSLCDRVLQALSALDIAANHVPAMEELDRVWVRFLEAVEVCAPIIRSQDQTLTRLTDPAGEIVEAGARVGEGDAPHSRLGRGSRLLSSPRICFISGEPGTPGERYRVERYAKAATLAGASATIVPVAEIEQRIDEVSQCDLLSVWRAPWTRALSTAFDRARRNGAAVNFDIDDLMFEPELAQEDVIDAIRFQRYSPTAVRSFFEAVRRTALEADFLTASTRPLARHLRRLGKPTLVLPNGFDEETLIASQVAHRQLRGEGDGLVRIGYATGSKTHQRDFRAAAPAVANILRAYPNVRLVLFADSEGPILSVAEFPEFEGVEGQIEWRQAVPLARLPAEIARFDINIAPLEVGNPFSECKSELKWFEAALLRRPTICSPSAVYREVVRDGATAMLAGDDVAWEKALDTLIGSADQRHALGGQAQVAIIEPYGPERRIELSRDWMDHALNAGRARPVSLYRSVGPPAVADAKVLFESIRPAVSYVTVAISSYNYSRFVVEALESAKLQTAGFLDLVVVDDNSSDNSVQIVRDWMASNRGRFNRCVLLKNDQNSGLSKTRNAAFSYADTPFVLVLDADNRLLPTCVEKLFAAAEASGAAYSYSILRQFGLVERLSGGTPYSAARFASGNYIDALALVRRSAWAGVGGYADLTDGWEDYDLWLRFAERGWFGHAVGELLAEYRVHSDSMLRTHTDTSDVKRRVLEQFQSLHPWLDLETPDA